MVGSSKLVNRGTDCLTTHKKSPLKMTSTSTSLLLISGIMLVSLISITSSYRVYKVYKPSNQITHSYYQTLPSSPLRSPTYQSFQSTSFRNAQLYQSPKSRFQSTLKKRSVAKNGKHLKQYKRQYRLISVLPKQHNQPINAPTKLIILKDNKAIPFTTVDATVSTPENESGSINKFEEGVGPATSFEPEDVPSGNEPNSVDIPMRYKRMQKNKYGREQNYLQESQGYPIYVQPPSDFKPIIYANRRLDGVSSQRSLSGQSVALPVEGPFPYGVPRGLSSWTLGGPRPLISGNFWENLGTDAQLSPSYQPNYPGNYVYRVQMPKDKNVLKKQRKQQKKYLYNKNEKKETKFTPWIFFPSSSFANEPKVTSFSNLLPLPSSSSSSVNSQSSPNYSPSSFPSGISSGSNSINSLSSVVRPITSSTGSTERRVTSENAVDTSPSSPVNTPAAIGTGSSTPSRSSSSSGDGIRTKLPVGLTSWMFGGVRDLTGKHWDMPEMTVNDNTPNVVSIDGSDSPVPSYPLVPSDENDSPRTVKDFIDVPDPMMTSDGEYESVDPVVKELPKETEVEGDVRIRGRDGEGARDEPVIYDEELDANQPESLVFNSLRRSS